MLLQKTLKPVQLHIHSLAHALEANKLKCVETAVTAAAWTRARAKLKHSALYASFKFSNVWLQCYSEKINDSLLVPICGLVSRVKVTLLV